VAAATPLYLFLIINQITIHIFTARGDNEMNQYVNFVDCDCVCVFHVLLGAIIDKISSSSFFPIAQEISKIRKDIRETIITIEKG
jgi:hypothetical protein